MNTLHWAALPGTILTAWLLSCQSVAQAQTEANPKQVDQVIERAINFLRTSQDREGSWSRDKSPGVTGVVVTGLLRSGKVGQNDPMLERGLGFIESLVNPKEGHIAGQDPREQLLNYVTSVNVMALQEANRDKKYEKVIGNAANYLKRLQWDEAEGIQPNNDYYGGAGYDSKRRPDLSNTQFFLDALQAAGVGKDDPALKKAMVFVSRCQNYKSENNDQPWAGKIDDGTFIYSAANGGQTKAEFPDGRLAGYGSMTYAGIKSLIYCGARKDDPRIQKAFDWIKQNYTVEKNPGMPPAQAMMGLYYYYQTMAKCLAAMGIDQIEDAKGVKHDWRAELAEALAKRQRPDGSWINEAESRWMEGDPNLATAYALIALSYCKPTQ